MSVSTFNIAVILYIMKQLRMFSIFIVEHNERLPLLLQTNTFTKLTHP